MSLLPTGTQYTLTHETWQAVVTEQGATLRQLSHNGRQLITTFAEDASPEGCQGQQLLPWPNRIRDGVYHFDGVRQELALSEPARGTALHGLVNWRPWTVVEQTASSLTQQLVVYAEPGWPGVLAATITHRLDDDGLTVEVTGTNVGTTAVPYGYAAHPYVRLDAPLDEWSLQLPFEEQLLVDDRLLPIEIVPVEGTPKDFRQASTFGAITLDTAFCGVSSRDDQGRWVVTASAGDQRVSVWADQACSWLQVYTPDDRASLAVEPCTCGPDAFNEGPTHGQVIRLDPGQSSRLSWGITD